jgi:hypothetical protein
MQAIAVIILVAAAAFFLLRRFLSLLHTGRSPCGHCSESSKCAEQQKDMGTSLEDHREDTT